MSKTPTKNELRFAREIVEKIYTEKFHEIRALSHHESALSADAESLRDYLIHAETRTFCILSISFMEDALRRVFVQQWAIDGRQRADDYFGSNGPLSTMSQRVLVATGLGWMTEGDKKETALLRKIRNEFAHNHRVKFLTDDPLAGWAEALTPVEQQWACDEMPVYRDAYLKAPRETVYRMRVYCGSMLLVSRMLTRAKLIGAQLPPDFRVGVGFDSFTAIEQGFVDHAILYCFGALKIREQES